MQSFESRLAQKKVQGKKYFKQYNLSYFPQSREVSVHWTGSNLQNTESHDLEQLNFSLFSLTILLMKHARVQNVIVKR